MPTNFHLAPPPKMVDGLLAVPIDIQSVTASFVLDGATQTGSAEATISYIVGPTDGHPIFDLRQGISQAWLDGAVFPVAQLTSHDFGGGMLSGLRIAFTTWHDSGANDALPFDFSDPPITLCSRDPWQRTTPGNSYSDGETFWKGMADLLGVGSVNTLLAELYNTDKGQPVSTQRIEELLLARSGNPQTVDAFHHFVYGFADPVPAPQLWLRDDPGHTGSDDWGGPFWNSPDLWVRREDDGGLTHQSPEHGQQLVPCPGAQPEWLRGVPAFRGDVQLQGFCRDAVRLPRGFPAVDRGPGGIRARSRRNQDRQGPLAPGPGSAGRHPLLPAGFGDRPLGSSRLRQARLGAQQPGPEEPHDRRPAARHVHRHPGRDHHPAPDGLAALRPGDLARPGAELRGQPDPSLERFFQAAQGESALPVGAARRGESAAGAPRAPRLRRARSHGRPRRGQPSAGTNCSANYDATGRTFPLAAQGTGAQADAYFNNPCGYTGEVYAHAYAKASSAANVVTISTQSDPAPDPYTGVGLGDNYGLKNIPWSKLKVAKDCQCTP